LLRLLSPDRYLPVLALLVFLAIPYLTDDRFFLSVLILVFLFALLGTAWNILGGYGGQLSIGHAAYFGIGAYTSTLLLVHFQLSPWIGMLLGGAAAMALSLVLGATCFRLRGPYFTIATIGVAEVMRLVFLDLTDVTRGARGIELPYVGGSWVLFQFATKAEYYYVAFVLMLVGVYVTRRVSRSALGYRVRAIGQNEAAAMAVGHNPAAIKQRANFISAFLTAVAGTFYAQYLYYIEPNAVFGIGLSVQIALVAIIGGVGTVWGPVVGAFLLEPLAQYTQLWFGSLPGFAGLQLLVYGAILMLVIIVRPLGLIGFAGAAYRLCCERLPGPPPHSRGSGPARVGGGE
jgi:branched-chain amino acid transport system permease protein